MMDMTIHYPFQGEIAVRIMLMVQCLSDQLYIIYFQANYKKKWSQLVEAFRECCDAYPDVKWSLEYKPTDENTRFFTVPSTGAAMLLINDVDRPNMGLTLPFCSFRSTYGFLCT